MGSMTDTTPALGKDEWIEIATAAYIAAGVEPSHAQECADATYGAWVDGGSDPTETPEECVEADLECWSNDE